MSRLPWLICLAVGCAGGSTPPVPPQAPVAPETIVQRIDDLPAGVPLVFVPEAPGLTSPLGSTPCAWFEWAYGDMGPEGWRSWSDGGNGEDPVQLRWQAEDGRQGRVEVSWRLLRPHVAPSTVRSWAEGDPDAPGWAKDWQASNRGSVTATEYVLALGATYHGVAVVETYHLPPEPPDFEPGEGRNTTLVLSDQRLVDGEAPGALTPLFQGWSY